MRRLVWSDGSESSSWRSVLVMVAMSSSIGAVNVTYVAGGVVWRRLRGDGLWEEA